MSGRPIANEGMITDAEQERPLVIAPTRPAGKLNGVDALRGLAAILVVTLHTTHTLAGPKDFGHEPFAGLFGFGRSGVDFFFVLSGFVIAYVHWTDIGSRSVFSSFWYKRLLRIYPTYWAATACFCVLLFISPSPGRSEQDPLYLLTSLTLWPTFSDPLLGVGWSLRHELLFYGLFSLLIFNPRAGFTVLGVWMGVILFNMTFQCVTGLPYFDNNILGRVVFRGFNLQFFFGITTALLVRGGLSWRPGLLATVGAIGFLCVGMWESFGMQPMHEWPVRILAYALCSALTLYGVATLDKAGRTKIPRFVLRIGAASYSIYLTHLPVVLVVEFGLRFVTPHVPMTVEIAFFVVVGASIIAGVIFSEVVEQPILRWGRRRVTSVGRARQAA
jgi:peptidoglycan/LPS O-acetylase OafA/YrhL